MIVLEGDVCEVFVFNGRVPRCEAIITSVLCNTILYQNVPMSTVDIEPVGPSTFCAQASNYDIRAHSRAFLGLRHEQHILHSVCCKLNVRNRRSGHAVTIYVARVNVWSRLIRVAVRVSAIWECTAWSLDGS